MTKIRGKISPGNTEGGFGDIGPDANAASLTDQAREDEAVDVVNPATGPSEAKGLR
jgi:hypothetical protein